MLKTNLMMFAVRNSARSSLACLGRANLFCLVLLLLGLPTWAGNIKVRNNAQVMKVDGVYEGFKLQKIQPVQEANAKAYTFEHIETRAKVFYLSNQDDNKVFAISFRTPIKNSKGLPHILEHAVLCGSKKYPLKAPFNELAKGSLKTYLNAMTFPERTMYPVASRNPKDFINLMDVYLDAVFFPAIYTDPLILQQEGWRYEVDSKTKELSYNGVVYSEMKGNYSNPESVLWDKLQSGLYPDTVYAYDSGGDPNEIPQLNQQEFIEFHKQYYHPSNAYIYLYGDGNIQEHLRYLQTHYLSQFQYKKIDTNIAFQRPPKAPLEKEDLYSVNPGDSLQDKTFLSQAFSFGRAVDGELKLAMDMLNYIVVGSESGPLKRALLDAKIGKEIWGYYYHSIQQPFYIITAKGANPDQKKEFQSIINKTLEDLATNGIDPKLIEAAINTFEFSLREMDPGSSPKGLVYAHNIMPSWLNGGSPLAHLQFEPILKKIKSQYNKGYFENIIRKNILKNNFRLLYALKPQEGLEEKSNQALVARLAQIKNSMSEQEIEKLMATSEKLKTKQSTPDTAENQAKLPILTLKDVSVTPEVLPLEVQQLGSTTLLKHDLFTSGIHYLRFYFDLTALPEELLPYAKLLTDLYSRMDTQQYSFRDLSTQLDLKLGGFGAGIQDVGFVSNPKEFRALFYFEIKVLDGKFAEGLDLLKEILLNTKFSDQARLKEVFEELKLNLQNDIASSGDDYAEQRSLSYFSRRGVFGELVKGISFFKFVSKQQSSLEGASVELAKAAKLLLNRNNLSIGWTANKSDIVKQTPVLEHWLAQFPSTTFQPNKWKLPSTPTHNEAFIMPLKVNFVAQSSDVLTMGSQFSGHWIVLNNILSKDFLWNRIRVQAGAYGAHANMSRDGLFVTTTYRDPNIQASFEAFKQIPSYVAGLKLDERELTKYILGTISSLDFPMTPKAKGWAADTNYFVGYTDKDRQIIRKQVLSTTQSDLNSLAKPLTKWAEHQNFSVVGGQAKINETKSLFLSTENLGQ